VKVCVFNFCLLSNVYFFSFFFISKTFSGSRFCEPRSCPVYPLQVFLSRTEFSSLPFRSSIVNSSFLSQRHSGFCTRSKHGPLIHLGFLDCSSAPVTASFRETMVFFPVLFVFPPSLPCLQRDPILFPAVVMLFLLRSRRYVVFFSSPPSTCFLAMSFTASPASPDPAGPARELCVFLMPFFDLLPPFPLLSSIYRQRVRTFLHAT